MLADRLRNADDERLIYHYCSAETLLAIVQNKTLRFSDINMLNDAEEGWWGYRIFEEAATNVINRTGLPKEACALIEGLDKTFVDKIDTLWSTSGLNLISFVSCFSTERDSLSQWRAYADDGRGFAIGFRVSELRRLPVQILDVEYDYGKQLREMEIAIASIYMEYSEKGKDESKPWFLERCVTLAASAIAFKNPAWRDEREVRCQHMVDVDVLGDIWTMKDMGGVSDGQEVSGQPVRFQTRNGSISSYVDMPFSVTADRAPIVEIVMGPKCPNGPGNLRFLLGNAGYGPVKISSAGGAYR